MRPQIVIYDYLRAQNFKFSQVTRKLESARINYSDLHYFYFSTYQQLNSIGGMIFVAKNHTSNAGLDDQFCTFYAWRGCYV